MRTLLLFVPIFSSLSAFPQLKEGYVKEEARDIIAICNSFTFLDLYKSDASILPEKYKKRYTSPVLGMDNRYQIYQSGTTAVINLRGSTSKKISWMENINAAMIPATGIIDISGKKFSYCFAKDSAAAVHSGYALAIDFLSKDLLPQINKLNQEGIYNFIITGHSQGGSLASMLRAYLENLPEQQISKQNKFKNYAFAAPMIGNRQFAEEYNRRYCANNSSFNIVNPQDPIPTFPLSYNKESYISDNVKNLLLNRDAINLKKTIGDGLILLMEEDAIKTVNKFGTRASEQITNDVGLVIFPPYVKDINYYNLGNRVEIMPVPYPKILKDSSILNNDSLMTVYKKGDDGYFVSKELYKKEPWGYQHKPYNYYVSILKMYFPQEYGALRKKYL